jgi:hypothetical protein
MQPAGAQAGPDVPLPGESLAPSGRLRPSACHVQSHPLSHAAPPDPDQRGRRRRLTIIVGLGALVVLGGPAVTHLSGCVEGVEGVEGSGCAVAVCGDGEDLGAGVGDEHGVFELG